jgi:ATP-binding cassette subfamily F protein 3
MAMFNLLVQWDGIQADENGCVHFNLAPFSLYNWHQRLLTWGNIYDNNKFIRRGQNILKRLERMDRIEKPVLERKKMDLELKGWRGSNKVLEIVDLDKGFSNINNGSYDTIVLAGLDLLIWRGERVGLVGPNGAGKSLLFRLILGQDIPGGGTITIGPSVRIGYYSQHHETLEYDTTLVDTVRQIAPISESRAVAFLNRFLFSYEQQRGFVRDLSGGERSRLQLALLMLSDANFLLLDEPTNNLDIPSAEVLENVLVDFDGTVLVISHDRYFLDQVVNRIVELDQGDLTDYPGGYSDYYITRSNIQ